MSRPPIRKLKGGCYAVTLVLAPDLVAFAKTQWRALGHYGIEDYLNTVLNTALFHHEMEAEPPPATAPDDRPD